MARNVVVVRRDYTPPDEAHPVVVKLPWPVETAFEHVQSTPAAEWIINHNLGFKPSVTVLSVGGMEVEANVVHVTNNQVRVYFVTPQAGSARLS